jgi:hypothetical protein
LIPRGNFFEFDKSQFNSRARGFVNWEPKGIHAYIWTNNWQIIDNGLKNCPTLVETYSLSVKIFLKISFKYGDFSTFFS